MRNLKCSRTCMLYCVCWSLVSWHVYQTTLPDIPDDLNPSYSGKPNNRLLPHTKNVLVIMLKFNYKKLETALLRLLQ
jgi:hypothetical protein